MYYWYSHLLVYIFWLQTEIASWAWMSFVLELWLSALDKHYPVKDFLSITFKIHIIVNRYFLWRITNIKFNFLNSFDWFSWGEISNCQYVLILKDWPMGVSPPMTMVIVDVLKVAFIWLVFHGWTNAYTFANPTWYVGCGLMLKFNCYKNLFMLTYWSMVGLNVRISETSWKGKMIK